MAKPKTKATKQLTKSGLLLAVVDSVGEGATRKDVKAVMDALVEIGHKELKKHGVFVLRGQGSQVRDASGAALPPQATGPLPRRRCCSAERVAADRGRDAAPVIAGLPEAARVVVRAHHLASERLVPA